MADTQPPPSYNEAIVAPGGYPPPGHAQYPPGGGGYPPPGGPGYPPPQGYPPSGGQVYNDPAYAPGTAPPVSGYGNCLAIIIFCYYNYVIIMML